ncbi:dUTP diphosphatase [Salinarimonas chemoclinalis]|uniref:dUTP diphosphatase n=1 Tax=Salinarimonas chemoclinalis TaxID=3241599 RepID=UPI0035575F81
MTATIRVERLPHCGDLSLPKYETEGAAGLDLLAAISHTTYLELGIRERVLVPTGFALELPEGYEAQVRPRSGLAANHGVTVLNAPGTIDADYRGEVMVLLVNLGDAPFRITRGMRIAQLVIAPVARATLIEVAALGETPRAGGGFGSTGA